MQRWAVITRLVSQAACLTTLAASPPAMADDNRPVSIEIHQLAPGSYRIGLRVPPSIPPTNRPALELPSDCKERPGATIDTGATQQLDAGTEYRFYDCPAGFSLAGRAIRIRYPLAQPAVATVVRVVFMNGQTHTTVLAPGDDQLLVPEPQTRSSVARDYLGLGIHHIWVGIDHLLFLVCLIFIAGNLPRILTTITGFTVAHSLTLALSALDVVRLPVPPIEVVIALSVVFLASEVARGRRDNLTWRYPITVSAAFGLLHGLGFAAVLNEIGLPQTELVTGLLFFNVGVEIGQILFAIPVVMGLWLVKRAVQWRPEPEKIECGLQTVMGYCVGCLAMFWVIERAAGFVA